jgi:hypothetical protein
MTTTLAARWHPATRLAFRFCALYFVLFVWTTQMLASLLPFIGSVLSTYTRPDAVVVWIGQHVLHVATRRAVSGSGDTVFNWVLVLTLLLAAAVGAILWSLVDRRRDAYPRALHWLRIFVRFALGSTLLTYGVIKLVPLQMPAPPLTRLLEPYGHFSLMGVLWSSIGASFPYERFVGLAELTAGALLFLPQTATLGALLALADTIEVFALNMTYDVPVKLFSFHLILMAIFLLAPDVKRLSVAVFAHRAGRRSTVAQALFGVCLIGIGWFGARQGAQTYGAGAPKPPFYGIWTITNMARDGAARPLLATDAETWRRVVIQSAGTIVFWRMDDTPLYYQATYDADTKTFSLAAAGRSLGTLTVTPSDPDRLAFDGTLDGRAIHLDTERLDYTKFQLLSRGFRWVQEYPYNR